MNRILAIVPLAIVAIAVVVLGISLFRPEEALRDPAVGRDFPAIELTAVGDFPAFDPSQDMPKGPALVNVWASWCAPCLIEHPMLMGLAQDGVPIYGVDYKERADGAGEAFLRQHGNPFTAVGHDTGPGGLEMGITGVPETFVIDANGTIVAHYAGPLDVTTITRIIRPALDRATAAPTQNPAGPPAPVEGEGGPGQQRFALRRPMG